MPIFEVSISPIPHFYFLIHMDHPSLKNDMGYNGIIYELRRTIEVHIFFKEDLLYVT